MQTLSNKTVEYVQCVLHVSIPTLNPYWIHPYSWIREILIFSIKLILNCTLALWNTPNWHLTWILGRTGLPNLSPNFVGSGSHILFWNTQFWDLILSGWFWSGLDFLKYWAQMIRWWNRSLTIDLGCSDTWSTYEQSYAQTWCSLWTIRDWHRSPTTKHHSGYCPHAVEQWSPQ